MSPNEGVWGGVSASCERVEKEQEGNQPRKGRRARFGSTCALDECTRIRLGNYRKSSCPPLPLCNDAQSVFTLAAAAVVSGGDATANEDSSHRWQSTKAFSSQSFSLPENWQTESGVNFGAGRKRRGPRLNLSEASEMSSHAGSVNCEVCGQGVHKRNRLFVPYVMCEPCRAHVAACKPESPKRNDFRTPCILIENESRVSPSSWLPLISRAAGRPLLQEPVDHQSSTYVRTQSPSPSAKKSVSWGATVVHEVERWQSGEERRGELAQVRSARSVFQRRSCQSVM